MALSELNVVTNLPYSTAAVPTSTAQVAAEFDAMIWEMLLRESGLTRAFGADEGSDASMYGEFFVQDMARQLATQIDIGFGRMAFAQAANAQQQGGG